MLVRVGMSLERPGWFARRDVEVLLYDPQAGFVGHAAAILLVAASNAILPRQYWHKRTSTLPPRNIGRFPTSSFGRTKENGPARRLRRGARGSPGGWP